MSEVTKPCECGKRMILVETGLVLASIPERYVREWWCGGCGRKETAPPRVAENKDAVEYRRWESANRETK